MSHRTHTIIFTLYVTYQEYIIIITLETMHSNVIIFTWYPS